MWIIRDSVGIATGSSKSARSGWSAIGNKIQENFLYFIPALNEHYEVDPSTFMRKLMNT